MLPVPDPNKSKRKRELQLYDEELVRVRQEMRGWSRNQLVSEIARLKRAEDRRRERQEERSGEWP